VHYGDVVNYALIWMGDTLQRTAPYVLWPHRCALHAGEKIHCWCIKDLIEHDNSLISIIVNATLCKLENT